MPFSGPAGLPQNFQYFGRKVPILGRVRGGSLVILRNMPECLHSGPNSWTQYLVRPPNIGNVSRGVYRTSTPPRALGAGFTRLLAGYRGVRRAPASLAHGPLGRRRGAGDGMLPPLFEGRSQELPAVDGCLYRLARAVGRVLRSAWRRLAGRCRFRRGVLKNSPLLP